MLYEARSWGEVGAFLFGGKAGPPPPRPPAASIKVHKEMRNGPFRIFS